MSYATARAVRQEVAELMRPRDRIRVSDAARKYVTVSQPGGYNGPLDPAAAPYMIEPMDLLSSRRYAAVVFVGPAQSGKTLGLIGGLLGYVIKCDPSDMAIIQTSQVTARDYSKRTIDRIHRNSEALKAELSHRGRDDNIFDKHYRAGNILSIGWPSISQLSGRSIKYMALTDRDRMPEDVDKEGDPFSLALKRTTAFMSAGMTLAESSPGFDLDDPDWEPSHPHEAPPVPGIASLFNMGDRRRLYWPCQRCGWYFLQPLGMDGFRWPEIRDLLGDYDDSVADQAVVPCPKCGGVNEAKDKPAMVAEHRWVPQGCLIQGDQVVGEPRQSEIASFWLPGAAAAFQTWASIVRKFLTATLDYELTGSEEKLKSTTNLDQGAVYSPRSRGEKRDVEDLERRSENLPKRVVPTAVRFMTSSVDVQGNRFVVQVRGYGVGMESWLIDRFNLHWSRRWEGDARLPIDPAAHIEDWSLLIDKVIQKSYPIEGNTRYHMPVLLTACDSGGRAGVTSRAYEFWRILRPEGLTRQFILVKGEGGIRRQMARVRKSYPDSRNRSDRKADARGEIPVYMLNTIDLKDGIDKDLKRADPGPGYIHFPDWLGRWFYDELAKEVRTAKGWEIVGRKQGNEGLDLLGYDRAAAIVLGAESISWDNPPDWAKPWEDNPLIIDTEGMQAPAAQPETQKPKPAETRKPSNPYGTNSWL